MDVIPLKKRTIVSRSGKVLLFFENLLNSISNASRDGLRGLLIFPLMRSARIPLTLQRLVKVQNEDNDTRG